MTQIDIIAKAAGFLKAGEITTSNIAPIERPVSTKAFGMDLVPTKLLPEGWIGLRTENGVVLRSPTGKVMWIPACLRAAAGAIDSNQTGE